MSRIKRPKKYKNMNIRKKKLDIFSFFTALLAVAVGLELVVGAAGLLTINSMLKDSPTLNVEELYSQESTRIFDKDGNQISDVGEQLRENISYDEIPEALIDAFLSIEDSRYFTHNGFDISRFAAAALANLRSGSVDQGGSTFTMQLVKLTYFFTDDGEVTRSRDIEYKVQQIALAMELEKQASKQEIFELYLNKMNFGGQGNIRGVEKASEFYFNKRVSQLNLSECALLSGIINSPYYYDPYNFLDYSTERRNQVLDMMLRHGYINEDEYYLARAVNVEDLLYDHSNDAEEAVDPNQAYIDAVLLEAQQITNQDPLTVAMDIQTAMDPAAQQLSADICAGKVSSVQYPADQVEVGFVTMNNQTGEVVAIGGGRNYSAGGAQLLNHATSTYHSPGSCVKPFMSYALAFEYLGWATSHVVTDRPVGDATHVYNNFDGVYRGDVTLEYAIQISLNTPAIIAFQEEINELGINAVTDYVSKLGFSQYSPDIFDISWTIGGNQFTASPEEIAGAHSMLMNEGQYIKPHCITNITFRSGTQDPITVSEQPDYQPVQVLSPQAAYLAAYMMSRVPVSPEYNYANNLQRSYQTFAKSGTSDWGDAGLQYGIPLGARKDKWMVVSTTQYTISVWNGFDKADAAVQSWFSDSWDSLNIPGVICGLMLDQITGDSQPADLARPDGISDITHIKGVYPYVTPIEGMDQQYVTTGMIKSEYAKLGNPEGADAVADISEGAVTARANEDTNTVTINWTKYPDESKLKVAENKKDISLKVGNQVIQGATGNVMFDYSWVYGPIVYKARISQAGQSDINITSTSESYDQDISGLAPDTETTVCGYYAYEHEDLGGRSSSESCTVFRTPEAKINIPSSGSQSEIEAFLAEYGVTIARRTQTTDASKAGQVNIVRISDNTVLSGTAQKPSSLRGTSVAIEYFVSSIDPSED